MKEIVYQVHYLDGSIRIVPEAEAAELRKSPNASNFTISSLTPALEAPAEILPEGS